MTLLNRCCVSLSPERERKYKGQGQGIVISSILCVSIGKFGIRWYRETSCRSHCFLDLQWTSERNNSAKENQERDHCIRPPPLDNSLWNLLHPNNKLVIMSGWTKRFCHRIVSSAAHLSSRGREQRSLVSRPGEEEREEDHFVLVLVQFQTSMVEKTGFYLVEQKQEVPWNCVSEHCSFLCFGFFPFIQSLG